MTGSQLDDEGSVEVWYFGTLKHFGVFGIQGSRGISEKGSWVSEAPKEYVFYRVLFRT